MTEHGLGEQVIKVVSKDKDNVRLLVITFCVCSVIMTLWVGYGVMLFTRDYLKEKYHVTTN